MKFNFLSTLKRIYATPGIISSLGILSLLITSRAFATCADITGVETQLCTMPADAASMTVNTAAQLDGAINLTGSGTVTVNAGGSIEPTSGPGPGTGLTIADGNTQKVVGITGASGTVTVNNSGTIQVGTENLDTISIVGSNKTVNINNASTGVIRNSYSFVQNETIVQFGTNNIINVVNDGTIRSASSPTILIIESAGGSTVTNITNNQGGSIIADGPDDAVNVFNSGGMELHMRNAGSVTGDIFANNISSNSTFTLESTSSITGNVNYSNGGTLRLDGGSNATLDVSQIGAGLKYQGFTRFDVESGATLGGFGALGGTLTNSGIVSPGSGGNTTGTLSVVSFDQASAGTLHIGVADASSAYDSVVASGNATLADGNALHVNFIGSPVIQVGDIIRGVVVAAGTLTVNANAISVTDNSPLYDLTAST